MLFKECNLLIKKATRDPEPRNNPQKLQLRREWVENWSKTEINFINKCIVIDGSAFDINMRPSTARSARGTPAVIITPSTKAASHTILGVISSMGVVNTEIRVPVPSKKKKKVIGSRKRKATAPKKPSSAGTNSGYPEMKGLYLMDNFPIHYNKKR